MELHNGPCAGQVVQVEPLAKGVGLWPLELYVSPVLGEPLPEVPAARWRYVWAPGSARYVWDGGRPWPVVGA